MASSIHRNLIVLFIACSCVSLASAQDRRKPATDSELLALVAGNALSENIVHEIESRGLSFHPTNEYRDKLTAAGADPRVLAAVSKATSVGAASGNEKKSSGELLDHLSAAGKSIRAKQYQQATQELDSALQSGGGPETGFVMGELLKVQEQWPMAASLYAQVLKRAPDFPEAHTKLSYLLYRMGDPEESLREAKAALAQTPENAEAHKNAGLALESARKFDAATVEYKEALRIKPDYVAVRYDLGLLLYNKGDLDGSVTEYKKAIALDPSDATVHYNLGITFYKQGDLASSIREFREAKRLDPKNLRAREILGSALAKSNLNAEAVIEFRELEAMAPDSEVCHICLAGALHRTWDFQGASQEYRKAAEMDPSDPEPHIGLGAVREDQKNYDAALKEYRRAELLDENSPHAHRNAGRVLIAKKDYSNALLELKQAENLQPSDSLTHDLYGQALQGSGNFDAAVSEFKQALSLDSKQTEVRLELAAVLEKKGDWVGALEQYRLASLAGSTVPLGNNMMRVVSPNPQLQYKDAQQRFSQHLAALKAAGNSVEAEKLESGVAASKSDPGASQNLDAAMQAGANALTQRNWEEAVGSYKRAVELAEKIQPRDGRLPIALGELGRITMGLQQFSEADAYFQRQMKATEELYGAQSPMMSDPLQNLGMEAFAQHDPSAEKFFARAIDLNVKAYGENSAGVSNSLRMMAGLFAFQHDFAKSESILLRAVKIDETIYGHDGPNALLNVTALCSVYDQLGNADKAAPCQVHLLAILEKQYGPDNPILVSTLTGEAQALRKLGRNEEATKIEQRIKSLQATAVNQD
jgi:tetratricopeptide (TPR) repeat protein